MAHYQRHDAGRLGATSSAVSADFQHRISRSTALLEKHRAERAKKLSTSGSSALASPASAYAPQPAAPQLLAAPERPLQLVDDGSGADVYGHLRAGAQGARGRRSRGRAKRGMGGGARWFTWRPQCAGGRFW